MGNLRYKINWDAVTGVADISLIIREFIISSNGLTLDDSPEHDIIKSLPFIYLVTGVI